MAEVSGYLYSLALKVLHGFRAKIQRGYNFVKSSPGHVLSICVEKFFKKFKNLFQKPTKKKQRKSARASESESNAESESDQEVTQPPKKKTKQPVKEGLFSFENSRNFKGGRYD